MVNFGKKFKFMPRSFVSPTLKNYDYEDDDNRCYILNYELSIHAYRNC